MEGIWELIVGLLVVIAYLLWSVVRALNRLEGVVPAARRWLDEKEQEEALRATVRRMEENQREEQRREDELNRRKETPGCQETKRGGGLRYVLPGEADYEYTVPLGSSTKAHFMLCNAGFESTLKENGFWAYMRTREPGHWISGHPVPTREDFESACETLQSMGYSIRRSADEVREIVDSIHDGYPYARDYHISKDGLTVEGVSEWARRRKTGLKMKEDGFKFKTKMETKEFVEAAEAEGFTFWGKEFLT